MIEPNVIQNNSLLIRERVKISWILLLYFFSGLCSLIDEVVWARLLKNILGNTTFAATIVISTFMGGLALGALIMSKYADKIKKKLKAYIYLEICATLCAIAFPFLLQVVDVFYKWFYQSVSDSSELLIIIQIIISAIILLIPTIVMGSTLPLMGSYITKINDKAGRTVGFLYLMNTFGAALGCFLAGFVLIRLFGIMGTVYTAAVLNLLVALVAWILYRFYDSNEQFNSDNFQARPSVFFFKSISKQQLVLLTAFFMSGFISIGYEIVWMRSTVFYLGGWSYIFSSVLTIYLIGNAVGALVGTMLAQKLSKPKIGFGISLSVLGILGVLYIAWLSKWSLDIWPYIIHETTYLNFSNPQLLITIRIMLYCLFIFFLPSFAMGVGFPLALQSWGNLKFEVGKTTGVVYGVNTIGAVLGGIITGFLLIPAVGIQIAITLLGISGLWTGVLLLLNYDEKPNIKSFAAYLAPPLIITILVFFIPMNTFKEKIISSPTSRNRTIDVFEGITTTVTVNKDNSGGMELCSDGLSIAGDNHHRLTQKMLGHLGPLVNKYSKDVLDIGFGAGETAACLAKHKLNKIECIEIAPELVKMAYKYFSHINMGENIEKLVDIKYMDGKNYLHLTPKKYDVIINDVNLPSYSGSAPLFTIENFTNGRNHLKEHGIFITKLHLQDISTEAFNSITGTFLDVFPFVTIWYPSTQPYIFFYLIGSNQKQFFSPSYIKNQLADEEVRESLTMLNMKTNLDVLSCYIGDEKDIRRYIRNYVKNSDSYPYLEFSLDRSKIETTKLFHEFIDSVRQNSIYDHIDWSGYSQEEITTTKLELKTIWQLASYTLKTTFNDNNLEQLLYISKGLKINPKQLYLTNLKLQVIKQIQKEITRRPEQNEMLLNNIENVLLEYPDASLIWLVKAFVFINKKDLNHAYEATLTSIKNDGLCPENQFLMGQILVGQNKPKESVVYFEHVTKLSPDNEFYRCKLGIVYVMNKRINDAFKQFDRVVQQNPNNADAQYYLGETCLLMKNKELAIKKFKKVLELQPNNPKAIKRLNSLIKENGF